VDGAVSRVLSATSEWFDSTSLSCGDGRTSTYIRERNVMDVRSGDMRGWKVDGIRSEGEEILDSICKWCNGRAEVRDEGCTVSS